MPVTPSMKHWMTATSGSQPPPANVAGGRAGWQARHNGMSSSDYRPVPYHEITINVRATNLNTCAATYPFVRQTYVLIVEFRPERWYDTCGTLPCLHHFPPAFPAHM